MSNIPIEEVVDPKELLEEIERLIGDEHTSQSPDADTDEPEDVLAEMAAPRKMTREDYEGRYNDGFLNVTDSSRENIHFTLHSPTPDPNPTPTQAQDSSHTPSHTPSPVPLTTPLALLAGATELHALCFLRTASLYSR
jgi:hypothetical protein